jgi:hypothetical protein
MAVTVAALVLAVLQAPDQSAIVTMSKEPYHHLVSPG